MAIQQTTVKAKPASKQELQLSPELEAFIVVKLGRPRSLWRWLNRVIAWATGDISRDEWDLAFDQAVKALDGKPIYPEDAGRRAEKLIAAHLDAHDKGRVQASCVKCDRTETAIVMAFIGRPQSGFYHARAITLKNPEKRRG